MPIYSHSRLATFKTCRRQYYYHYVARIELEGGPDAAHLVRGTCVHETLEALYRKAMTDEVMSKEELIRLYEGLWRAACAKARPVVGEGETLAECGRVGRKMVRAYYEQHAPFNGTRLIGLEQEVRIDLNGDGRYRLKGYIDRLSQRYDGTYEIHDYKTSKRLPTQSEVDADRQLGLYDIGLKQMWKDTERVELKWHSLRHEKELHSTRTPEQLEELKRETIATIDDIESRGRDESRFETCESGLCEWCDYQHVCPVRKHLFKTAELPVNKFLKDSGVKLVNRHAKLTGEIDALREQIGELDAEREQVDEALLAFADREGVEVVVGSDCEAKVSEGTQIILPTKGESPDEYAKLDAKLRRSEAWPEVSTLDSHAVRRIWKGEDEDPGGVKKIIKPFVREEATRAVRVRARKDR